jgi:hypothetical protein
VSCPAYRGRCASTWRLSGATTYIAFQAPFHGCELRGFNSIAPAQGGTLVVPSKLMAPDFWPFGRLRRFGFSVPLTRYDRSGSADLVLLLPRQRACPHDLPDSESAVWASAVDKLPRWGYRYLCLRSRRLACIPAKALLSISRSESGQMRDGQCGTPHHPLGGKAFPQQR